jgi:predicted NAD-dependent protein-ADP-ribosyltransferase YbiA (DUF1768 family)
VRLVILYTFNMKLQADSRILAKYHNPYANTDKAMHPDGNQQLSYEAKGTIYWFSGAFDPFNNWSAHAVKIWGQTFSTIEHAYHYRKFTGAAPEVAAQILLAPSPWAAMQIERQHKNRRRADGKGLTQIDKILMQIRDGLGL